MLLTGGLAIALRWPAGLPRGGRLATVVGGAGLSSVLATYARRADAADRARALRSGRTRVPRIVSERIEAALVAADVSSDPAAALQVWLLAVLAAGCLAGGLDLVFAPAAMVAVLVGGPVGLYLARHRGARRSAAELPVALELVASELRTGGTVIGALATLASGGLARGNGLLTAEFARITRRCALGAPLDAALAAWAAERCEPGVSSAAGALAVAATTGGRSAEALDGLASSLRDRSEIAAEARALSAQARLSAMVVGSLPVVYLGACALLDPRQVRLLTQTTLGLTCLAAGLTLEGVAALWIRALLRQDA
ncbi:MAG: tight adherence protein [Actinomycetota bacterium]|nr:tight adherence protein [Actinomycetota bacterium]